MYYTGLDPRTMEPVYVPTDPHEKAMQRALIQYRDPKNYALVHEALVKAGRTDLIGFGEKCLIRPRKGEGKPEKKAASIRPPQKKTPPKKQQRRPQKPERSGPAVPTEAQLRQAERYLKKRKK